MYHASALQRGVKIILLQFRNHARRAGNPPILSTGILCNAPVRQI
jgi:hypothetical protein